MSLKYLGDTLDIHGGGQDLIFPHHENEIAQSESFTGKKPFVKYWLHNGLVQLGEDKMSKSLGNLITIKQALEKYSPDAIRIFILSSHYRSPLSYSEGGLEAAERGVERLWQANDREGRGEQLDWTERVRHHRERFIEAMDDDFNTAQAVAILFDVARDINRLGDEGYTIIHGQQLLTELADILGLTLKPPEKPSLDAEPFIQLLISTRDRLREAKQFQLADEIRAKLGELGIVLEDTPKGTVWKRKR
jgi:cysteinyl-tRNA synthetase